MSARTADVDIPHLGKLTKITVNAVAGGDTFYQGSLVFADSSDGLAQLVPASGDTFLGICAEQTVAAAGDPVPIYIDGVWALKFTGVAAADVGHMVGIDISGTKSDNEEDIVAAADFAAAEAAVGDILVGKCVGINTADTTRGWVYLHHGSGIANLLGYL